MSHPLLPAPQPLRIWYQLRFVVRLFVIILPKTIGADVISHAKGTATVKILKAMANGVLVPEHINVLFKMLCIYIGSFPMGHVHSTQIRVVCLVC